MDINVVYNKMIEKLKVSNNQDVIIEIKNSAIGAATGSEALMLTGFYLLRLKQNNPLVYQLIKEEIKKYLKYCNENGLIIDG